MDIPEKDKREIEEFVALNTVLRRLRAPDGCPWDREQTPETIKKYLLEEAYELYEAVEEADAQEVKEELGDLFFLLLFLADLYRERGEFSLADSLEMVRRKMIRRHPHIFGNVKVTGSKDVVANWQAIKGKEAKKKGKRQSVLGNLPLALPALQRAFRLGERASRVGFDWQGPEGVLEKLQEEVGELQEAIGSGDKAKVEEEMGDLLFTVANLSRKLGLNPEEVLKKSLKKFVERFQQMEDEIAAQGKQMADMDMETLERFWQEVK